MILYVIYERENRREYWLTYLEANFACNNIEWETITTRISEICHQVDWLEDIVVGFLLRSHQLAKVLRG